MATSSTTCQVSPTQAKAALQGHLDGRDRADAHMGFDQFVTSYVAKYSKATGCLLKDREPLLAFYDFPA